MSVDVSWLRYQAFLCNSEAWACERRAKGVFNWLCGYRRLFLDGARKWKAFAQSWEQIADEIEAAAKAEGDTLQFAKVEAPFPALAEHAVGEYRAGQTRGLRDFAREKGISLDAE